MKKILVIEDSEALRHDIAEMLEYENYDVVQAEDGIAGLECAKAEKPDLILCDVMMPRLGGEGVRAGLRQIPELASTPVIFLTAKQAGNWLTTTSQNFGNDYLVKPFTVDELSQAIERAFQSKG